MNERAQSASTDEEARGRDLDTDHASRQIRRLVRESAIAARCRYLDAEELEVELQLPDATDTVVSAIDLFLSAYSRGGKVVAEGAARRTTLTLDEVHYNYASRSGYRVRFQLDRFITQLELTIRLSMWPRPFPRDVDFVEKLLAQLAPREEKEEEEQEEEEEAVSEQLVALGAELVEDGLPWDALSGCGDVKRAVRRTILLPFLNPATYRAIVERTRVRPKDIRPRAVLFHGPPGTGKTSMGRIIAQEIGRPFLYVPVEAIYTCWYGQSARRLEKIFKLAGELADEGCVLFIDEIDAVASRRQDQHQESRKVLSVLLTHLDGLKTRDGVLLIGTTNLRDELDRAVRRRFDEELLFALPDANDRAAIIAHYAQQLDDAERTLLAERTEGMSGSDLERLARTVERTWAQRLLESGDAPCAPDITAYLELAPPASAA